MAFLEPGFVLRCLNQCALHLMVHVFLLLASAFWLLILLELLPALIWSGPDGIRDKLLHIWSMGRVELSSTCQDYLTVIHEGYTDLILLLQLTWAALECKRFLYRQMAAEQRRRSQIPAPCH